MGYLMSSIKANATLREKRNLLRTVSWRDFHNHRSQLLDLMFDARAGLLYGDPCLIIWSGDEIIAVRKFVPPVDIMNRTSPRLYAVNADYKGVPITYMGETSIPNECIVSGDTDEQE